MNQHLWGRVVSLLGRLFAKRKPKLVRVSEREIELIQKARAEVAGHLLVELDSDDNMPPTALNMQVAKRSGKGFKNLTTNGNLYETKLIDDINQRFADNERISKQNGTA